MDIKQIRSDFDHGNMISRPTWGELLAHAEEADAVLAGRQQKIGEQSMTIAGLECRITTLEQDCRDWEKAHKDAVALPRQPSNPAAHDWAAPGNLPDLIARLRASIAGKESFEEAAVFVANISAAIQCLESMKPSAPQAVAAPDRAVAYAIYGIGGGLIYLKEVKEIQKSDTTGEWRGDDGGLGDYWAGNEGLALMGKQAPQPIAAPTKHCGYTSAFNCNAVGCGHIEGQDESIAVPADPMDWPLPCDVKVGCGTHGKGTSLRSLVGRMQRLYDEVVAASPLPEGGLDRFAGIAASQQPVPALSASIDSTEFRVLISAGNGYDSTSEENIVIEYVDTWAAQLVQQRATLSDEQIIEIAASTFDFKAHKMDDENKEKYLQFVYVILAAAGAK